MIEFHRVAKMADIAPGEMKVFDVEGTEVAVANVEGAYFAIANSCPHEGGPLAEGEIEGMTVVCPWHFTAFDITTGKALEGVTEDSVKTYIVRLEGDDILIAKP